MKEQFEKNIRLLENVNIKYKNYNFYSTSWGGGYDQIYMFFTATDENYTPLNKYGTYNTPPLNYKIIIEKLGEKTEEEIKNLISEQITHFKKWAKEGRA